MLFNNTEKVWSVWNCLFLTTNDGFIFNIHQRRSSVTVIAWWILPMLVSAMETSDGSQRTFFITGSIVSITGLEDPCHLLKLIFFWVIWGYMAFCAARYHRILPLLNCNSSGAVVWLIADWFGVNFPIATLQWLF